MDRKNIIWILHLSVAEWLVAFQGVGQSHLFWKVQRISDIRLKLGIFEQLMNLTVSGTFVVMVGTTDSFRVAILSSIKTSVCCGQEKTN